MRHLFAAALVLAAFSSQAGTISSIAPASIQAFSGEPSVTLQGQQLGTQVIFDGPTGPLEVEATAHSATRVVAPVPLNVVNTPGDYTVRVGDSNEVSFRVTNPYESGFMILGQDPVVVMAESARGARVHYDVQTYGGGDPNPVIRCEPPSGSWFPVGPSHVHCVAENKFGQRAEGGVYIYVQDAGVPLLELPEDIVVTAESGDGAVVTFQAKAHDDVDGELPVTCNPRSGSRFPIGVTTVECTATDSSLNPSTGTFTVTVKQKEGAPPQLLIQVPADIEVEAESSGGTRVEFSVTTYGSTDPEAVVTCDPPSNSVFPVGATKVLCTATDRHQLRAEATFHVIVVDTTPPSLRIQNVTVPATSSAGAIVNYEASADDFVDGEVPIECEPPSGSSFPVGTTLVQCTAVDAHENVARGTFEVTVTRDDRPQLLLQVPNDIEVEATSADGTVVTYEVTTHGSTDPSPFVGCQPPSESLFPVGETIVTCTAQDRFGQQAEGSFTVRVVDRLAPMISTITATPNLLAPANHKLIDVKVSVQAVDTIDPMPRCSVVDVTANESVTAEGSGNTEFDWTITGALSLQLRAERSGTGNDRVYRVWVTCTDASNNSAHGSVEVVVPKSASSDGDAVIEQPGRRRSVGRGR